MTTMATRIFDTYHASEDEIETIKQALEDAELDFYETRKGNWWVGSGSLWIKDDSQVDEARRVIEDCQLRWQDHVRSQPREHGIRWRMVPVAALIIGGILYLNFYWLY